MENKVSKATIFALGGMNIESAIAYLEVPEQAKAIITGIGTAGKSEKKVGVYSIKHISEIIIAVIVLFILSPFLILVSTLVFASAIRSVLLNQEQAGVGGGKLIKSKFRNMVHHARAEQYDCCELEKSLVVPGQKSPWQILPDGKEVNLDNWTKTDIQYIDNRSLQSEAALFLKTFRTVLLTREN